MNQKQKYDLLRKSGFPVWEARLYQLQSPSFVKEKSAMNLAKIAYCAEGATERHFDAWPGTAIQWERETYYGEMYGKIFKGFQRSQKNSDERDSYGQAIEVDYFEDGETVEEMDIRYAPKKKRKRKKKKSTIKRTTKKKSTKPKRKTKRTVRPNHIPAKPKRKKKRKTRKH